MGNKGSALRHNAEGEIVVSEKGEELQLLYRRVRR